MAIVNLKNLRKLTDKYRGQQLKVMKVSLFVTFNGAIIRSPVGNPEIWNTDYVPANYIGGQFRANWRMDLNKVSNNVFDTESESLPNLSLQKGVNDLKVGDTAYFTNPSPYGPRLEYDAWSSQAPDGMVRIEAANFRKNVNAAIRKTR